MWYFLLNNDNGPMMTKLVKEGKAEEQKGGGGGR